MSVWDSTSTEKIVAEGQASVAQGLAQTRPVRPVLLRQCIFEADDRKLFLPSRHQSDDVLRRQLTIVEPVNALLEKMARRHVDGELHIAAGLIAGEAGFELNV